MTSIIPARRLARCESVLRSARQIIASREVTQFCVGITAKPTARKGAYDRWCRKAGATLDGFAILDWERTADHIIEVEGYVFRNLCDHKKYGIIGDRRYYPSVNRRAESHVFYVAWWSPAFWHD